MRSGRYMSGHTAMSCVKKEMHRQFGDEILLEEEKHAWEHHGWFLLKFQYIPKPYMIQFEGEFNCFNVRITKDDDAYIALKKLTDYSSDLTEKDICDSIEKLKNVLKGDIVFYRSINGKTYQEINGEYKRIRRRED